jgi:hypothetical protein
MTPGEVDAGDRGLVHGDVRLLVEQVAQGMAARRRLQQVGGHLVEQRLERVVVVLVDECDVDIGVLQLPRRADAAEATPEHDHVRAPGGSVIRGPRCPTAGR